MEGINYNLNAVEATRCLVNTLNIPSKYEYQRTSKSIDIMTASAFFIEKITGVDKLSVIVFLAKNRKNIIFDLYVDNYITDKEIELIYEKFPEIFYVLPDSFFYKYPRVISFLRGNKNVDTSKFSTEIKIYLKSLGIKCTNTDRTKTMKNNDSNVFYNSDGSLYQFFKMADGTNFATIEDYELLLKEYFKNKYRDINFFYKIYGISDGKGFANLLSNYKKYYGSDKLNNLRYNALEELDDELNSIMEKFLIGEIDFDVYFKKNFKKSHRFEKMYNKAENKADFIRLLIRYIFKNKYILPYDKLNILSDDVGPDYMISKYALMCGINANFVKLSLKPLLCSYRDIYGKNKVVCTIIDKEGNKLSIDDDIVNKALEYLNSNGAYICHYTVFHICKEIVLGNLVVEEDGKNDEIHLKRKKWNS